jgi:carbamoyltransferase
LTPFEDKDIVAHNKTPEEVAQLIADKNIVAIFQGRSEAGPRALGNRSIVYDARDPDGKDFVNKVKGREWFRPFAGSVLKEDANDWFDMAGMEESPYMMYAVNVAADKLDQIPCVSHVDDTCRVQTVSEEDNAHYYSLIKAYKEITGVPVIFNTSFNLAGDPLVETLDDALETLFKSKMKYLWIPEINVLVTKLREDPPEHIEECGGCEVCDDEEVTINTEE